MYNKEEYKNKMETIITSLNNIKNNIKDNHIELEPSNKNYNSNFLNTEEVFDFSNIGNDSIADTSLINKIFAYAKENGYNYILFPKERTFLIEPEVPVPAKIVYSIEFPGEMTIDLNKSTLKIREDYDTSITYNAFGFEHGSRNTIVMNGTILGNKYTSPHKDSGNSNTETIYLLGYNNKLVNMTIKETLGDGIIIDGGNFLKSTFVKADLFSNIDLSSGTELENPCVLSSDYLEFSKYFVIDGDMYIESNYAGKLEGEEGSLHWKVSFYVYYFYNENKELIKSYTTQRHEAIYREMIPKDTYYVRLSMISPKLISGFPNHLYLMSMDIPRNCELINCTIDDASRNGITVGSSSHCAVRNSIICNSKRYAPQYGIDIEPEMGACDGFIVENCNFFNNHAGDFVAGKFRNLQILNNRFNSNVSAQGYNFVVKNNVFSDSVGFSMGTVDEKIPFTAKPLIEQNIFFNKNMTVGSLLTLDNCIFRDNYVYNINVIRGTGNAIIEYNEFFNPSAKTVYNGCTIIAKDIKHNNFNIYGSIIISAVNIDSNIFNRGITISNFNNDGILNITNNQITSTVDTTFNKIYPIQYWAHQYKMVHDVVNIIGNSLFFTQESNNTTLIFFMPTKDVIFNIKDNYCDYKCNVLPSSADYNVTVNKSGNFNIN